MENTVKNGAIIASGKLYEEVKYNVSNLVLSACFNGKGGIDYCSVADGPTLSFPIRYVNLSLNGEIQNGLSDKKVSMLGRRQICEIYFKNAVLKTEQFLSERDCGVYTEYSLISDDPGCVLEMGLMGGIFADAALTQRKFASDCPYRHCAENSAVYFKMDLKSPRIRTFISCSETEENIGEYIRNFTDTYNSVIRETDSVGIPRGLDETEKALYCSAFWCALENYKEKGDYKGFMAGCNYLSPMRTYYRDSYYTVLPMYNGNSDKVLNQIITLARGIGESGSCPSAVKSDWSDWWGDHYDSPSFLAMMLRDYINFSGDISAADIKIGNKTVFERTVTAIEHLAGYADDTGLLYKDGHYNKRDWTDEVNRWGYVTYDQLLYARALYCIADIFKLKNNEERYLHWLECFKRVKNAVNAILWNEEKGYYVNFKNGDYTEDNLSIDTVFAAIFGIADNSRAKRMLIKMEKLLETPNNGVPIGFGSMCVFPFYKKIDSAANKSTQCFDYHNGANWPYLSAMYAYAKRKYGMNYKHLLTVPFEYNLKKGNYTPIEYFSPYCRDGSLLQAWSGASAFVLDEETSLNFFDDNYVSRGKDIWK